MIELEILTSDADETALAKRYWQQDSEGEFVGRVSDLLPFREITSAVKLGAFMQTITRVVDLNQTCRICGMHAVVTSRSQAKKTPGHMRSPCDACRRAQNEAEQLALAKKDAALKKSLDMHLKRNLARTTSLASVDDDIALILIALERAVRPRLFKGHVYYADFDAVMPSFGHELIGKLRAAGLITDDPRMATAGAYAMHDNGNMAIHLDMLVYFLVPEKSGEASDAMFAKLLQRQFNDFHSIRLLWLDYASADCMTYFYDECILHCLDISEDDDAKLRSTMRTALERYSIAQLWSMIWKIVRDAASFSTRKYSNLQKAAATIPNKLINHLDQVDKGETEPKPWERPSRQSAGSLGKVFKERFGLDEKTPGYQAMTVLATPVSSICDGLKPETLAALQDLMTRAAKIGLSADATLGFAYALRDGVSVMKAVEWVYDSLPQLRWNK